MKTPAAWFIRFAIALAASASGLDALAQNVAAQRGRLSFDAKASPERNEAIRRNIAGQIGGLTAKIRELDLQLTNTTKASSAESMPEGLIKLAASQSERREQLATELGAWMRTRRQFQIESTCGATDDSQDVELYDGSAGPPREFVALHQAAVGQIQWNSNLDKALSGPGESPGDVQDIRWCTGTLIKNNLFLTAGHCFDTVAPGWSLPKRANKVLPSAELAKLMHVNFNYQVDAATGKIRNATAYPIVRLLEHRLGGLDYSIVELGGAASGGGKPLASINPATLNATASALQGAKMLTIIQHPNGEPKKIAAGASIANTDLEISYSDVDTQGGASGSGVLDQSGQVIGVHTMGGCDTVGANSGATLLGISRISKHIK